MRFDLEHPDITRTLLTGYPTPEEDWDDEEEVDEVETYYEDGYDIDRAYDEARDLRYFGDL